MPVARRATIYFNPRVHRALRLRAASLDQSVSEVVNDTMERALADEGAHDIALIRKHRNDPGIPLAEVVKSLRRRGKV